MDYITLPQAARILGCCVETLRRAIRQKKLKCIKPGKAYQTTEQWLREWAEGSQTN